MTIPVASGSDASQRERHLAGYLSATHARWLADPSDSAWRELDASLVFADISGFTALSEKLAAFGRVGSELLTDNINSVFRALLGVCWSYGGDVLKFGGDALLILFPRTGHTERAASAAWDMQAAMRQFTRIQTDAGPVSLGMSVGLASGPVQLLLVGDLHRELVVVGPTATDVVRAESAASKGQVFVSPIAASRLPPRCTTLEGEHPRLARSPRAEQSGPLLRRAGEDPRPGLPEYLHDHEYEDGEHRVISVAFVQARGIDELLASDGPEAVAHAVDWAVGAAQRACERHGVSFFATDVDNGAVKMILVSGAPTASSEDADLLLHAALEVVQEPCPLPLRAGINRGQAFVVEVGDEARHSYTVMGDTVNLSARVMGKSTPGELLATDLQLARTRTRHALQPLEPFPVKGKTGLINASLVREPISPTKLAAGQRAARSSLVGRDRELEALQSMLDLAARGLGRSCMLIGDPGIGKTRLVEALLERAGGMTVLGIEAGLYAAASPYFALRAPVRALIGVAPDASDGDIDARLKAVAEQHDPELGPWLPLLGPIVGTELEPTPETAQLAPEFLAARTIDIAGRLLGALLPPRRSLIVVEDGHWLDEASSELVGALLTRRHEWAWCVTRRPGSGGLTIGEQPTVSVLEVGPLDSEAARDLIAEAIAVSRSPIDAEAVEQLLERADGNPLFLEELLAAVAAGESLDALPDTVEGLLTARIDVLSRSDRRFLRDLSVLGSRPEINIIEPFMQLSSAGVRASLRGCSEFVQPDGAERVRFRHALVRQVAYSTLSQRRRRELHALAGELFERRAGASASAVAELLSLHYHEAHHHEKSWRWSRAAADHASRNGAPGDAAVLLRRALEDAGRLPEIPASETATVAEQLGECSQRAGHYQAARDAYRRARVLSRGDTMRLATLYQREGWLRQAEGTYKQAYSWYTRGERLLDTADPSPDRDRLRAALGLGAGLSRLRQTRYADAVPLLEQAASEAARLGDRRTMAHAYYLLDWALTDLGRPEQRYRDEALPAFEELGDPIWIANCLNTLGICAFYEGRWNDALSFYERAVAEHAKAGSVIEVAQDRMNLSEVLVRQGHLDRGEQLAREALEVSRNLSHPLGIGVALGSVGVALTRRGQFQQAREAFAEARAALHSIGAKRAVFEVDAMEAERLLLAGEPEAAAELARASLRRPEVSAAPGLVTQMCRVLGLSLAQRGAFDEAATELQRALETAREANARYEEALALSALGRLAVLRGAEGSDTVDWDAEAAPLLEQLGVVGELPLGAQ